MRVFVAVPVVFGRLQVKVDAGIHWSSLDRFVLWALKEEARTLHDLAEAAGLKARLVAEIVFRLMQVGWVEMASDTLSFRVSRAGERVLHMVEGLPSLPREELRSVRLVIEPVGWKVFSAAEVRPKVERDVTELAQSHDVRRLAVRGGADRVRLEDFNDVIEHSLRGGVEYLWIERCELLPRFLLASVKDGHVEGLPAGVPSSLVEQVKEMAATGERGAERHVLQAPREMSLRPAISGVDVRPEDIVLDGESQKRLLSATVRRARHRVLVHSTFLSVEGFTRVQEDLRVAAREGARIDIFYGADRDEETRRRSRDAALGIGELIKRDPVLRTRVRMHPQTTKSHAKLIVADCGHPEEWCAIVGSTNWLSTGFHRVEVSVMLRDGRVVGAVVDELRELCFAAQIGLGDELHRLGWDLRSKSGPPGAAQVRLVLGDEHALMMDEAREVARSRIWAGGDRFSHAGEGQSLVPLIAAAQKGVRGRVLFSRASGLVTDEDIADLQIMAAEKGVELTEVGDRVLHGKILLWDSDDVVMTSLNWSSAATRATNPWGEIGVHVRMPGLAEIVAGNLDQAIGDARTQAQTFRRERRMHQRRT